MEPIAIIGCAGRFPGAPDKASYWDVLTSLEDALREVPADRFDIDAFYDPSPGVVGKIYTRRGGFIEAVDCFDHAFFDLTPREAASADPQQRLLLETAWAALEDAAIVPGALSGSRTGVFFGLSTWDYNKILNTHVRFMDAYVAAGSTLCVAANRLSHWLNLRGPSMAVDTACSSSLVAVHMGCQSLLGGDADLAVVGGANVIVSPESSIVLSQAGMLAPDGRCKTFDARADGYVRSEGCGVFVLKRLADAQRDGDPVCAVILGSAVNHNGRSNGLTAPSGPAQQALIRESLARAGVPPEAVRYVETHGTGTRLGDPIEVGALRAVYSPPGLERPPLALGAAKAVVGHAEAAAGAAGLLKVITALEHECVPAQPPIGTLNPLVAQAIKGSALHVATEPERWVADGATRRIAAVSSFGFGGANAHVIVEGPERHAVPRDAAMPGGDVSLRCEAMPQAHPAARCEATRQTHPLLLPLSAKTEGALRELARRMARWLSGPEASRPPLADVCHTLQAGRAHWPFRVTVAGRSAQELATHLSRWAADEDPCAPAARAPASFALVFSGQGTLYAGVARELLEIETFRQVLERCDALVQAEAGWSMLELLTRCDDDVALNRTEVAQPLLYALHCAMVQTLRDWGMPAPGAVLGHSLGEFSAAWVAGVFSLEDGLRLVLRRARLMAQLDAPGAMLAVAADEARVRALLGDAAADVDIACRNAPADIVLAGPTAGVARCEEPLRDAGLTLRRLATSHAFHSRMMAPAQRPLREAATAIEHRAPGIALVSSVTGEVLSGDVDWPSHWSHQLCAPVQFEHAQASLGALAPKAVLELGAQPVLASLARRSGLGQTRWVTSLRRSSDAAGALLQALGGLHAAGVAIDWNAGLRGTARRVGGLPVYPFERHRHAVDVAAGWHLLPGRGEASTQELLRTLVWAPEPAGAPTSSPAAPSPAPQPRWVLLCGTGSALDAAGGPLRAAGHAVIRVHPVGASPLSRSSADAVRALEGPGEDVVRLVPANADGLVALLRSVQADDGVAPRVALSSSFLGLSRDVDAEAWSRALHAGSTLLAALLGEDAPLSHPWLVCEGAQAVVDGDRARPCEAAAWGLFKTALSEYAGRVAGLVDAVADDEASARALAARLASSGPARVLALRRGRCLVERLGTLPAASAPAVPGPQATTLITGAFGGIGLLLARHLFETGAAALLLQSRRPPSAEQQREIDDWRAQGRPVEVLVDPLTEPSSHARLAQAIDALGLPLAGIFHLAGARADAPIAALSDAAWRAPLAAKLGTLAPLRRLARERRPNLLVYFSSIAALVGSPAQAGYAAANAALEAIAAEDRAAGLPACCIEWGPWADAGAAARLDALQQQRLQRHGLTPIDTPTAFGWLRQALAAATAGTTTCIAVRADWTRLARSAEHLAWLAPPSAATPSDAQPAAGSPGAATPGPSVLDDWPTLAEAQKLPALLGILRSTLDATLGGDAQALDAHADIFQQGMDSLLLMEWLGKLHRRIGLHLYAREAYQHPTLDALARYLQRELDATAASPAPREMPEGAPVSAATPADAPAAAAEPSARPSDANARPQTTPGRDACDNDLRHGHPTAAPDTRLAPALFVLSAPRSGSTLLRAMLAGHSRLFAPPELHLLQFHTMRERDAALARSGLDEGLIRACMALMQEDADAARRRVRGWVEADWSIPRVYAALQRAAGDRLLVDKSPSYAMSEAALARIEAWFDGARAVHLVRDPHAMVESFERLRMHRLFGATVGQAQVTGQDVWHACNAHLLQLESRLPSSRWMRLSYEELVRSPEASLRGLCRFLGLEFEPALLTPHAGDRMTDGVREGGLQVGDPNFAGRTRIDPSLAQVDPGRRADRPLRAATQALAATLGYGAAARAAPAPQALREHWVEANGQRLCVCEWGPASGTPVLVLHGWQDQGATWDGVARRLADEGLRVIAPDLRHHGRHRAPGLARPTAYDFAADAQALARALQLRGAHLVGHSFGSVVAGLLAAAGEGFASLTLVEPVLPADRASIAPAEAVRRHLGDLRAAEAASAHASLEAIAMRLRIGFPRLSPEAALQLAGRIADPVPGGHACPSLEHSGARLVAALRDLDREGYGALLAHIDLPLLWLRGVHSTHRRARDDAALKASLQRARAIELAGGHNLHVDAPEALAHTLLEFLARPETQRRPEAAAAPLFEDVR